MKYLITLLFFALLAFAGSATAATLTGTWMVQDWCVPGDDLEDPLIPKTEGPHPIDVEQEGMFFVAPEDCYGIIDGKTISMTCPPTNGGTGTIFHGELRGNVIIGVNHIPDEGATCSTIAIRQ